MDSCTQIDGCIVSAVSMYYAVLHRLWLMYSWIATFHSRHHRLYVPYAYGTLYNHPVEVFLQDTIGAGMAFKVAGLSVRQGIFFFTFATMKTVNDHCGYKLPWYSLQLMTSNNAAYHDVHHQTWGIKSNFAQPFFTFWDSFLGTKYKGSQSPRKVSNERVKEKKP